MFQNNPSMGLELSRCAREKELRLATTELT